MREIADVRDETDLSGLKIAIDLKRGTDPEKLMAKLMKMTTLQDLSLIHIFAVTLSYLPFGEYLGGAKRTKKILQRRA